MSNQAHFWLRVAGIAVILAVELAPRLWTVTAPPPPVARRRVVASSLAR